MTNTNLTTDVYNNLNERILDFLNEFNDKELSVVKNIFNLFFIIRDSITKKFDDIPERVTIDIVVELYHSKSIDEICEKLILKTKLPFSATFLQEWFKYYYVKVINIINDDNTCQKNVDNAIILKGLIEKYKD
jgi:hypothetical protein